MINQMNRALRPFLIIILGVISLSFVFFTAMPAWDRQPRQAHGEVDGRSIRAEEFYDAKAATETSIVMKYGRQLQETPEVERLLQQQAWRRLLLLSSARQLGIQVTNSEVIDYLQKLPIFMEKGLYQPEFYNRFQQLYLEPKGISEAKFEEMVRDDLTIDKMQNVIVSPLQITPSDIAKGLDRQFSTVTLSFISFDPKNYLSKVHVDENEITQAYKTESSTRPEWRTKERRQVSYVSFLFDTKDQKLAATDKEKVKRQLAEKALNFRTLLDSFTETDEKNLSAAFSKTAMDQKQPIGSTNLFASDETPKGLSPSPHFNEAAFGLTTDHPISTPVETDQGFFVLHLDQIQQNTARPLAEIHSVIETELKNQKARNLALDDGRKADSILKEQVAKGMTFKQAATALQLNVETFPPFKPGDPELRNVTNLSVMQSLALSLPLHGVSPLVPVADGGIIASLDSKQSPEPGKYAQYEGEIKSNLLQQARQTALEEWFNWRNQAKGTQQPAELAKVE